MIKIVFIVALLLFVIYEIFSLVKLLLDKRKNSLAVDEKCPSTQSAQDDHVDED